MKEQELRNVCTLWQDRLRLLDWRVKIQFTHRYQMLAGSDAVAEILPDHYCKVAKISVAYPNEVEGSNAHDIEVSVVHELLHLHFVMLEHEHKLPSAISLAVEQAIEIIAEALVAGYKLNDIRRLSERLGGSSRVAKAAPEPTQRRGGRAVRAAKSCKRRTG